MLRLIKTDLVKKSKNGRYFRYISFQDTDNLLVCDRALFEGHPVYNLLASSAFDTTDLKAEIEGYVTIYNRLDFVVFEGESVNDAYKQNMYKLKLFEEQMINQLKNKVRKNSDLKEIHNHIVNTFNYINKSEERYTNVINAPDHLEYEWLYKKTDTLDYYLIQKLTKQFNCIEVFRDYRPRKDIEIRLDNQFITLKAIS